MLCVWPFTENKRIYLDYASAPPVREEALAAMLGAEHFVGNPGALHREGVEAMQELGRARESIAKLLEVKARQLIFTSGLTESNNIAILGFAHSLERTRRTLAGSHWLVSAIEHTSVLDCFSEVERLGGSITHVLPGSSGIIAPENLGAMLRPETVFVSVGWANNEIGTVQPLSKVARIISEHEKRHGTRILFHSDAGQAPLYLPTRAHTLSVDLMSLGSNKLYGPHGIGALYLSNRCDLARVVQGGPQERGLRPGTESVALAAGFATAYEACAAEREREERRLKELRDMFAEELQEKIPDLVINGDLKRALPHMLNISIPDINSEYVTLALDAAGIAISTKSACREGEESRSHVVSALGGPEWRANNTLRFSIGRDTTRQNLARTASSLQAAINRGLT